MIVPLSPLKTHSGACAARHAEDSSYSHSLSTCCVRVWHLTKTSLSLLIHPTDQEAISIYRNSHDTETGLGAGDAQGSLWTGWAGTAVVTEGFLEEVVSAGC